VLPTAERFVKQCIVRTVEDTRGVEKSYSHVRRSFVEESVQRQADPFFVELLPLLLS